MDAYKEKMIALVPSEAEMKAAAEKVKSTGAALLTELQSELTSGVEKVRTDGFSLDDTIERLKRVVGLVDKMVVTPLIEKVKPEVSEVATGAAESKGEADAEDEMHDAEEEPTK